MQIANDIDQEMGPRELEELPAYTMPAHSLMRSWPASDSQPATQTCSSWPILVVLKQDWGGFMAHPSRAKEVLGPQCCHPLIIPKSDRPLAAAWLR